MPVFVIGLNHKTAPLEVREQVAVTPSGFRAALDGLTQGPIEECAILSTCNRTEVYLCSNRPDEARAAVAVFYSDRTGMDPSEVQKHLYSFQEIDVVRHLFRVAAGLDSMILGEPQIAGQVKDASAAALDAGTGGTILNRLFQSAIEASKRARTETEIGVGAVSVSFVDKLRRIGLVLGLIILTVLSYYFLRRLGRSWLRTRACSTTLIALGLAGAVIGIMPVLGAVTMLVGVAARLDWHQRRRAGALT